MSHYNDLVDETLDTWSKYPRVRKEHLLNLVKSDRHVMAVAINVFIGQVCNGGFEQWMGNGYAKPMHATLISALTLINTPSCPKAIELIKAAAKITRGFTCDTERCLGDIDDLDGKFYEFSDELSKEVEAWFEGFAPAICYEI